MAELVGPTPEKRYSTIHSMIPWVRALLVGFGVLTLLFGLFVLLWEVPKRQVAGIADAKDRLAAESAFRQILVQLVGGLALLCGLYFTWRTLWTSQETLRVNQKTLETTQQGQITERFTKAIEQLGDTERLMVRLGGIYALERIARDSERDHWAVMEVLTAFVREQRPALDSTSGEKERKESLPERKPPPDIQAILTVIGRRTRTLGNGETQTLDLRDANLQDANLANAQLQGALLAGAQLQDVNLANAQLQGALLMGAQLQGAFLVDARLQGANLANARLQGAFLVGAQLQSACLMGAQLQDANLRNAQLQGADLTAVINLTQDQLNMAYTNENTILPEGMQQSRRPSP